MARVEIKELHAVFNGHYWDVSVGPHDYSQAVASCHSNATLGYDIRGAKEWATLFAAAPDLLDALKSLLNYDEQDAGCIPSDAHLDAQNDARAAIAKATQP